MLHFNFQRPFPSEKIYNNNTSISLYVNIFGAWNNAKWLNNTPIISILLITLSHCLNWLWVVIWRVLRRSPKGNSTNNIYKRNDIMHPKIAYFKSKPYHQINCALTSSHASLNIRDPLLIWINFNPSMDKISHGQSNMGWNRSITSKFQRCSRWNLVINKYCHPTFH